jgi:type IV pilus assembly protein PilE
MATKRGKGMRKVKEGGFTLIELMIVVAIVGILAAVAYPSYTDHIRKGVRRAAQAQMLDIANREQQFLLSNRVYVPYDPPTPLALSLTGGGYALPSELIGKYTPFVQVATSTVPAFTITFTATGTQLSDGNLTYNSEGVRAPADKW